MDFTGTIHKIFDAVQISEKFKKREVVLESSETKDGTTYTELVSFQFVQDKCELLDKYKVGDSVEVGFNLKGRKWTSPQGEDKYFNTCQAWMIHSEKDVLTAGQSGSISIPNHENAAATPVNAAPVQTAFNDDSSDTVPF